MPWILVIVLPKLFVDEAGVTSAVDARWNETLSFGQGSFSTSRPKCQHEVLLFFYGVPLFPISSMLLACISLSSSMPSLASDFKLRQAVAEL